jgi:hypothetical protein
MEKLRLGAVSHTFRLECRSGSGGLSYIGVHPPCLRLDAFDTAWFASNHATGEEPRGAERCWAGNASGRRSGRNCLLHRWDQARNGCSALAEQDDRTELLVLNNPDDELVSARPLYHGLHSEAINAWDAYRAK